MEVSRQHYTQATLNFGEIALVIHWIAAWMDPLVSMDAMEKRKILPLPGIKPRPPSLLLYQLPSIIRIIK
jgi:hypothetical protein